MEFLNFARNELRCLSVDRERKIFDELERHAGIRGDDNEASLNRNHHDHKEVMTYNGIAHLAKVERPRSHRGLEKSQVSNELGLPWMILLLVSELANDHPLPVVHVPKIPYPAI